MDRIRNKSLQTEVQDHEDESGFDFLTGFKKSKSPF